MIKSKLKWPSEFNQVSGTKWLQSIKCKDVIPTTTKGNKDIVNVAKWLQPSQCNHLKQRSKLIQPSDSNLVNATKWMQTNDYTQVKC